MKVSTDIERIVDTAFAGEQPGRDELVRLMDVDEFSLDAHYINWAADKRRRELSDNTAEVHAQIGIDANPCSKNCQFCSFAAINIARKGKMEMPIDKIIDYARAYVEQGANCLTVMITADYDVEQYLDYLAQVREAIGPDMPITANMGDFDLPLAERLKTVGVGSVYHAVRMGEGVITDIPLERRFQTIEAAQAAGLKILTCLEMIDPRCSNEDVADNMLRMAALKAQDCTAFGMIPVPGTKLCDDKHYTFRKYALYNDIMRLACGPETRFNGNLSWAEVGTNPRDDKNETENDGLGKSVEKVRTDFARDGWKTFQGPSPLW